MPKTVHRRRVFYIPGYDPIHPRRYRELYRRESAEQARISGYAVTLSPRRTGGPFGWHVEGRFDGSLTHTDFQVLVWSDIVRGSMSNTIPATYAQMAATAWTYISTGALARLMRLRKGPVIAALYPVLILLLQLLAGVLAGWLAGRVVALLAGLVPGLPVWAGVVPGWIAGVAVLVAVLRFFQVHDNRIFAYYLMHDYAFSARFNGANPPELEDRMAAFGDAIAEALTGEADEVLVVGHSSGAHLAVSVLADLIRAGRVPAQGPALSLLSLGQVVPMVSFLPGATRLRADLQYLSTRDEVTWIDVTAPGDGASFALCDPVAVSGVAPQGKRWPLVVSAAYTQTLSPERWKAIRYRFFTLHFQYLCAFDRPGHYDYFRITAGPQTLDARYAGRKPSNSRIDVAVSKYTSVHAA